MDLLFCTSTVSDDPLTPSDGDVVCAISREHAERTAARNICGHRGFEILESGYRDSDPVLVGFLGETNKYRFQRQGDRVERTEIATGNVDWLGSTPNDAGEAIDVDLYLSRRLRHSGHRIFLEAGRETWYGGNRKGIDWDAVWNNIETYSDHRRARFQSWEFSSLERQHFGITNCRGFRNGESCEISNGTCVEYCGPLEDENGVLLRKAKFVIPYWDVTSIDTDRTRNRNHEYDARQVGDDREKLDDIVHEASV